MLGWDAIPPWTKSVGILATGLYGWFATFHSDKLHKTTGDKKSLSGRGWLAVTILTFVTILSFVSSIRDDREAAASREKLASDMKSALEELQDQNVRTQSIGEQLSKTSQVVANSAADSQTSASKLGVLVGAVGANVKTTSEILRESKMSVTVYNLRVVVAFDAVVFDDELNRTILSSAQRVALEANGPLSSAEATSIVNALNDHRRQILEILFRRWEMRFDLMKRNAPRPHDEVGRLLFVQNLPFSGDEGASASFTPPDSQIRTPLGHHAAGCVLRYTVPLTGIPGLRTFRDLNGATVSFLLKAVPGSIGLKGAYAYLGYGGSGAYRERDELSIYLPSGEVEWAGRWAFSTVIPRDKYRMP